LVLGFNDCQWSNALLVVREGFFFVLCSEFCVLSSKFWVLCFDPNNVLYSLFFILYFYSIISMIFNYYLVSRVYKVSPVAPGFLRSNFSRVVYPINVYYFLIIIFHSTIFPAKIILPGMECLMFYIPCSLFIINLISPFTKIILVTKIFRLRLRLMFIIFWLLFFILQFSLRRLFSRVWNV
jgi:hypothetical protein